VSVCYAADGRDKEGEVDNLVQLLHELAGAREQRSQLLQMLTSLEQFYEKQYSDVLVVGRVSNLDNVIKLN
jgi:hypothetical protein